VQHRITPKVDWAGVARDIAWSQQKNCHIIRWGDIDYPSRLKHIAYPPPLLFVQGHCALLHSTALAIVGSRYPSVHGVHNAAHFAQALASAGFTITSGLALGIDGISHTHALMAGSTIAVLGNGLDSPYPAKHRYLAHRITQQGALVSEFPIGALPHKSHFPRRNRIISGLSVGLLVIEATLKSGSLITAKYALEQGREVFAIPGLISSPLSKGCHQLIREGAKCVETVDHIIEELAQYAPGLASSVE